LNVQWERKFKATGYDGKTPIQGHAGRFHAACDGDGATMTIVKAEIFEIKVSSEMGEIEDEFEDEIEDFEEELKKSGWKLFGLKKKRGRIV
jgi:hypothetical protein